MAARLGHHTGDWKPVPGNTVRAWVKWIPVYRDELVTDVSYLVNFHRLEVQVLMDFFEGVFVGLFPIILLLRILQSSFK